MFRAHTDPALFAQWIGPDGTDTRIDYWDARTGGSWRFTGTAGGAEYAFRGCFHEVRPGLIVQTLTYEADPDGVALETLWFEDLGGGRSRLRAQSLWIPPGEQRTFALIDKERQARPTAAAAKISVFGASVPASPPRIHVDQIREIPDDGKIVVQGVLANDADRAGNIIVIASFHDAEHRPMTRPFSLLHVPAKTTQNVQFVGPPGSVAGTIYFGDATF